MSWIAVGGLVVAAGGAVVSGIQKGKANKALKKIAEQNDAAKKTEFSDQQLGLAKQMFGGRMAGAPQLERNIQSSGANFNAGVDRGSTDGSQSLALKAAGLGQTNSDLSNMQLNEQQNKMGMLGNLNNAYGVSRGEANNNFANSVQIAGQQNANSQAATQSAINAAMAAYNVWASSKSYQPIKK